MYYKPNDSKSDEKYMETYNIFRLGDIAFEGHKSKNFAYGRFVENTIGDGIVSHVFDVFRPISEYDLNYWKYFIHYEDIMGQKLRMSTTKATMMNNLVSKDFLKQSVLVPNLDEQQKIGTFFKQLDHLITLHQRKIAKLKELKKGYLQKLFPQNSEKVPEFRFKGYSDAWEKRKLSDYAVYRRGSFPQPYGNKEWYNGSLSMPFVQVVDVSSNLRLNESTKQRISQQAQPMSVFVPAQSIVVTLQGSIGRVAITQYDAYVDRTLLIFERFLHPTDKVFFAYVLQKKFSEEKDKAPGGTIKTITKEALSSFEVLTPIISEQHETGSFLKNLDHLIAATQCKLDLLKKLKKGYLQKMFC